MERCAINDEIEFAIIQQKRRELWERLRRERDYGSQFNRIIKSLRQPGLPLTRQMRRHMIRKECKMTNGEKYKTAKERIEAHKKWCKIHRSRNKGRCGYESCMACEFHWLDLEDDEVIPMECPFCGESTSVYTFISVCRKTMHNVLCDLCAYQSSAHANRDDAIAAHNRVCKAVEAYKESEAKV